MLGNNFPSWPHFTTEEASAVKRVLLSNKVNYWTGNFCNEFESKFATWCGVSYAIALANGTLALDVAIKALGIGPGDEVIVTPRTFIASVSCIINAGASPIFADVDPEFGNITAQTISDVLTANTKAIICVHLAGWPCDMDPIMALASDHKIKVIEDCAQAHGAIYKNKSVGSLGHIAAWSFCQDKIITTGGEGGMVTTNDESLWETIWSLKDHGKNYKAVYNHNHENGFRWLHESFGSNYRMMEMQAVIGIIQLDRLKEWTRKRQENATFLTDALKPYAGKNGPIRLPNLGCESCKDWPNCVMNNTKPKKNSSSVKRCIHAQYKFYLYVRSEYLATGWSRDVIIEEINAHGVPCFHGTCPEVYLEKAFDKTTLRPQKRLPNAKLLGETSLMLLVHPSLRFEHIKLTASVVTKVLQQASL